MNNAIAAAAVVCPTGLNPEIPPNFVSEEATDRKFREAYDAADGARAAAAAATQKAPEVKTSTFPHQVTVNTIITALNASDARKLPRCRLVVAVGNSFGCGQTFGAIAGMVTAGIPGLAYRQVVANANSAKEIRAMVDAGKSSYWTISGGAVYESVDWANWMRTPHTGNGVLFLFVHVPEFGTFAESGTLTTISWQVLCQHVGGANVMNHAMVPRLLSLCQAATVFVAVSPEKPELVSEVQPSAAFMSALVAKDALFAHAK